MSTFALTVIRPWRRLRRTWLGRHALDITIAALIIFGWAALSLVSWSIGLGFVLACAVLIGSIAGPPWLRWLWIALALGGN